VRQRKVVTEITIETNQVLVIERKQVTRSRCSECASEAEFVRPDLVRPNLVRPNLVRPNNGNVLVDERWKQRVVEAPSCAPDFTEDPDGSDAFYRRSLLGATMLVRRFLSYLSRSGKRECLTPRLED
jgi:hypothetical protein